MTAYGCSCCGVYTVSQGWDKVGYLYKCPVCKKVQSIGLIDRRDINGLPMR